MSLSRRDSRSIRSRYSCSSAGESPPFFSSRAKPAMDTMGVLNSWEKLLMKSERSISVLSSSEAILLKLEENSFTKPSRENRPV